MGSNSFVADNIKSKFETMKLKRVSYSRNWRNKSKLNRANGVKVS